MSLRKILAEEGLKTAASTAKEVSNLFEWAKWDPMGAQILDEGDGTWLVVPSDEWTQQDGRQSKLVANVKKTLRNTGWRVVAYSQGTVTIRPN